MSKILFPGNSPLVTKDGLITQLWAAWCRAVGVTDSLSPVVKSGTYAMAAGDTLMLVSASSGWSLTLPDPGQVIGVPFYIKKIDNNTNAVTILPHGTETIDGAGSKTLATAFAHMVLVSEGTNWWMIS